MNFAFKMMNFARFQAMTLDEIYIFSTTPPFGDALQGPHPTIDGWVLPTSAVKLMDGGGFNAASVLIGANSFDGIFGGFDGIAPDSKSFFQDFGFILLGLSGFSLSVGLKTRDFDTNTMDLILI